MDQFTPRAPRESGASGESHPGPSGAAEPAHGTLFPATGRTVDTDVVLAFLREQRLLAALSAPPDQPFLGAALDFVVVADPEGRALTLAPDGRHLDPGPTLAVVALRLAEATGLGVDLGEVSVPATQQPTSPAASHPAAAQSRPGGVLLGALAASSLPVLARRLGAPLEVWPMEFGGRPHHLVRAPSSGFHLHRFGTIDLPVLSLSRLGDAPYLSVLTTPGHLPGAFLSRMPAWLPSLTESDLSRLEARGAARAQDIWAWFTDPHRAPGSELATLCSDPRPSSPLLADVIEATAVSAALQSNEDDMWSHRVLTALGAPTLLADLHEGRLDLGEPQVVEPSDPMSTVLRSRRRPLGRAGGPARHRR